MATRLRKELTYAAGVEQVAAMLADPAFREEVLARQRVLRGSVTVEGGAVDIEQVQSADGVPSYARKLVGDEIVIRQHEQWTSPTTADLHVSIPGKPGEMSGTATLTGSGAGTVHTVELQIRVGVPLVGGKIEGLVAALLEKALEKEHEAGVAWLAERA